MNLDPAGNSQPPWRVLRVKTGAEFEVTEFIQNLGYESYCPRAISYRGGRPNGKIKGYEIVRALFPSYTMAKINPDARLDRLARRGLLRGVFYQRPLSEAVIAFIRVTELEATTLTAQKVKFKPGDFGSIMIGVLKGEPVEVLQVRRGKLIVKLTRFDPRSAPISVAEDSVQVTA